jgi:nitrate/nitrite-specific signal transduction histidine kinase
MGLRIMRYRADLIGADLQVQPAPEKGTMVTCACPRSGAAAGPVRVREDGSDRAPA